MSIICSNIASDIFINLNKPIDMGLTNLMTFAEALRKMEEGSCVQRVGWNGAGLFVFKQVEAVIPMSTVPNMQSLPGEVKEIFKKRFTDWNHQTIMYKNQFCIVYPDSTLYGWAPSASDVCSDDWVVF